MQWKVIGLRIYCCIFLGTLLSNFKNNEAYVETFNKYVRLTSYICFILNLSSFICQSRIYLNHKTIHWISNILALALIFQDPTCCWVIHDVQESGITTKLTANEI